MGKKIKEILKELGIPMGNLGFGYILEAVKIVAEDKTQLQSITKHGGLYWMIAKKFGTTPTRVERAIRHAIEQSFLHCNAETLYKYFGNSPDINSGKLANRNFIAALANEISMTDAISTDEDIMTKIPNAIPVQSYARREGLSGYSQEELIIELFNRVKN